EQDAPQAEHLRRLGAGRVGGAEPAAAPGLDRQEDAGEEGAEAVAGAGTQASGDDRRSLSTPPRRHVAPGGVAVASPSWPEPVPLIRVARRRAELRGWGVPDGGSTGWPSRH